MDSRQGAWPGARTAGLAKRACLTYARPMIMVAAASRQGAILAAVVLALIASEDRAGVLAQAPDDAPVVQTDQGAVRGHVRTNLTEWLGIP